MKQLPLVDVDWNEFRKALYYDAQGQWDKSHEIVDRGADLLPITSLHIYTEKKEVNGMRANKTVALINQFVLNQ